VKGYSFIDISSDRLIIENSVQFEESVSHVPQQLHADTFVLPPVRDDEHAHADSSSNESSDLEDSYDPDTDSIQSDVESVHVDADAEPKLRPKWAKTTLQDVGDLVGDPTDTRRTQSNFEEPPLALTATESMPPMHIFLVQSSDPQSYGEALWKSLLGIRHAGGVQLPPREPDLGSGSPSFRKETCQVQMGLQDQEHSGWTD
jgi:hypothetical protein